MHHEELQELTEAELELVMTGRRARTADPQHQQQTTPTGPTPPTGKGQLQHIPPSGSPSGSSPLPGAFALRQQRESSNFSVLEFLEEGVAAELAASASGQNNGAASGFPASRILGSTNVLPGGTSPPSSPAGGVTTALSTAQRSKSGRDKSGLPILDGSDLTRSKSGLPILDGSDLTTVRKAKSENDF